MAISTVTFTGDASFSATHPAGSNYYLRSTLATDIGTFQTFGIRNDTGAIGWSPATSSAGRGQIELLSSYAWDELHLIYGPVATGTRSLYANNGTAAVGSVHVHAQPANDDTLIIGLAGFANTGTFKTTVVAAGQIKIGATAAETADNLASYLNDTSTGPSTPVDGTDWNAAGANTYLSATVSGADVTYTDRIACARQFGWTTTASDPASLSVRSIIGGIDGTLIGTIAIGEDSISTSSSEGISLGNESPGASTNLPGEMVWASNSVAVRGAFVVMTKAAAGPIADFIVNIETSNDGTNWDVLAGDIVFATGVARFSGANYFAEYVRLNITFNALGAAIGLNAKIIYQSR